jgi:putative peptidoglycan lipid II flippase
MLNSLNVFFIPALSPAMFNVASIAVGIGLVPVAIGAGIEPILAMAAGTIVGGLGQVLLQWPALRAQGYRYAPRLDLADPGMRQVLTLMGPGVVGLAATQLNVFVNTVVATGEGTGAVSWLTYAFRLMYLPIGMFGVSIATATTPALSRLVATGNTPAMRSTLASAIALMLTLNVPATFGLVVLATPIVRRCSNAATTPADTMATASAVQFYAIGLVGTSVVKILRRRSTRSAAATHRRRSAWPVLLNATLSFTTAPHFGFRASRSAPRSPRSSTPACWRPARRSLGGLELGRASPRSAR